MGCTYGAGWKESQSIDYVQAHPATRLFAYIFAYLRICVYVYFLRILGGIGNAKSRIKAITCGNFKKKLTFSVLQLRYEMD